MKLRFALLTMLISQNIMSQTIDIQGHRGCRGLMPENSIPAFLKALDLGVTTLELDVVISKDRQVVVSHEAYFNPDITTDATGIAVPKNTKINLYQLTYEQIKTYDCGSRGNVNFEQQQKVAVYKPLLTDMIETCEKYRVTNKLPLFNYNIEIKSEANEYDLFQPKPAEFSDLVHAVLITTQIDPARVTLQSFDFEVLKHWHKQIDTQHYKPVKLAVLVANLKGITVNLKRLGFKPDIYSPFYKLLSAPKVQQLHDLKIKVIPWTVNTVKEMQAIRAMGVDGIITDYPDRAAALR
jgi:glycerophosphoryl diester phosphodiesterase